MTLLEISQLQMNRDRSVTISQMCASKKFNTVEWISETDDNYLVEADFCATPELDIIIQKERYKNCTLRFSVYQKMRGSIFKRLLREREELDVHKNIRNSRKKSYFC